MFPTFLGGKCKISGFHCSPAACLEVFIPSPFKWSLSSMHLWFSWRFLEFSGSNLVKISGRSLGQWKHHQQCDLSSQVIRLSKTQFIVLIVCKGVTTIIIESDCIQLSFFLILIEKWIFFWVYATPEKTLQLFCWRWSIAGYFDWLRHGWTLWQRQRSKSLEPWYYIVDGRNLTFTSWGKGRKNP